MTVFTNFESIVESKKKYKIIYADPPWSYDDKLPAIRGAESHYTVMSIDDLCNLPVKDIADEDCILFCWGTWPQINEILRLIVAWRFTYKTIGFNWIKRYSTSEKFVLGMGHWTRSNSEFCLIATKGKPKRIDAGISQIIDSTISKHSKKPDLVRQKILKLCGDLPRIELFARTRLDGWDTFGNDANLSLKPLEDYQ